MSRESELKKDYDKAFGTTVVPSEQSTSSFNNALLYSQRFDRRRKKAKDMLRVKKSQLVELKIFGVAGGNTATRFQFQDQPYLRFKPIVGLDTFTQNEVPVSPTNSETVTQAELNKAFLTLYINDVDNPSSVGEWMQNIPLAIMHRVASNAGDNHYVLDPFLMAGQTIIWDKSYITLSSPLLNTVDNSFLFNVYFQG